MKTFPFRLLVLAAATSFAVAADPSDLPDQAMQLKRAYQRALDASAKPIHDRYLADIKKLGEQYARAGKFKEALAVKQEIDSIFVRNMFGDWTVPNGRVSIHSDGSTRHSRGSVGKWTVQDGRMVVNWDNGAVHRYVISESGDKIQGKDTDKDGKTQDCPLTRIR